MKTKALFVLLLCSLLSCSKEDDYGEVETGRIRVNLFNVSKHSFGPSSKYGSAGKNAIHSSNTDTPTTSWWPHEEFVEEPIEIRILNNQTREVREIPYNLRTGNGTVEFPVIPYGTWQIFVNTGRWINYSINGTVVTHEGGDLYCMVGQTDAFQHTNEDTTVNLILENNQVSMVSVSTDNIYAIKIDGVDAYEATIGGNDYYYKYTASRYNLSPSQYDRIKVEIKQNEINDWETYYIEERTALAHYHITYDPAETNISINTEYPTFDYPSGVETN